MTNIASASTGSSTRAARAAAIVTWIYAAGFGGCIMPVSVYLLKHGSLPSFFGLFDITPAHGGAASMRARSRCC
jgi:hypothetical protein